MLDNRTGRKRFRQQRQPLLIRPATPTFNASDYYHAIRQWTLLSLAIGASGCPFQRPAIQRKAAAPGFQLPRLSACRDGESEADVVQAGQAAPDHHIAGRRIVVAGEIAVREEADFGLIGGFQAIIARQS
jgi:hypothetical protein